MQDSRNKASCDEERWVTCPGTLDSGKTCGKHLAKRLSNGQYEAKKKGIHNVMYAGFCICTRCGHKTNIPLTGSPKRAPSSISSMSPATGHNETEACDGR